MTLIVTAESHLDHGLTAAHLSFILKAFDSGEQEGVILLTLELPEELEGLPSALYGPLCGDQSVDEQTAPVTFEKRGGRAHESRLVAWPTRKSRLVSVIAGPHGDIPCLLYTAFGGPISPKEPADPSLAPEEQEDASAFWAAHALASLP